ncbi:MAG: cytochrome P450 [Chloroflexi bacterium]|nr:cytochrome P450 [Chloroflexota bacterium]
MPAERTTDSITVPPLFTPTPLVERDALGIWHVRGYAEAKQLMLADAAQAGFQAEDVRKARIDPVLYQQGEPHRVQRGQIARFFSPTTTHQKHMPVMEQFADSIIGEFAKAGRGDLNQMAMRMAVAVASAIVGLNATPGMVKRLNAMLHTPTRTGHPLQDRWAELWGRGQMLTFLLFDVRPAIRARRREPQDDVISYMVSKGKGEMAILAECVVYGAAGMVTTQEFISVVFWHCMLHPELRELMLTADQETRYEFLNEALRLEPVIARLSRRALSDITVTSDGQTVTIPAGDRIDFHLYEINADARTVADAPRALHPHRDLGAGVPRAVMGFGSGMHKCAGEFVAIAETDVFLRRLLALDGLRIEQEPTLNRNELIEGYELRNFIIAAG